MSAADDRTLFQPAANAADQDWPRLVEHLAAHGMSLDLSDPPRLFASGFGNLNYRIMLDGQLAVLRRPPFGPIQPGANDMVRESRILKRLWQRFPLAPRCLHACADEAVLGAPFFIMEYRPGLVIAGEIPAHLTAWRGADGSRPGNVIGKALVETLAALHAVDPADVGLDTLGRPEGFLERTMAGWTKRAHLAWKDSPPAELDALLAALAKLNVPASKATLLHNDFKLDNVILDEATLAPVAVIDWDMGTRGDPLYDLAVLLSYWTEKDDPPVMHRLKQMPSAGHGFPSREEIARHYAALTGRGLSEFRFHRVLSILRSAVVFMQLYRRYRDGGTGDERFAAFGDLANELLALGRDVAAEKYF